MRKDMHVTWASGLTENAGLEWKGPTSLPENVWPEFKEPDCTGCMANDGLSKKSTS